MITRWFAFPLLLFALNGHAQITITSSAEAKPREVAPYDSTRNYLGKDYAQYVGQEFYIIPLAESLRKYGFEGFLLECRKTSITDNSNVYACCSSFNSKYEALAGKYFKVLEVIESAELGKPCLKLEIKDSGQIVYFKYDSRFEMNFPFLVVGYFEKQKSLYAGKEVLIRPFPVIEGLKQKRTRNIETGVDIAIDKTTYYKCIDLTIDEENFEPALLCVTASGEKFLWALRNKDVGIPRLMTKEEAEAYRKKFGDENWKVILDEKVRVGMTEEMALLSWGQPEKINRSSTGDQWVYKGQFLYFSAGKLTAFN